MPKLIATITKGEPLSFTVFTDDILDANHSLKCGIKRAVADNVPADGTPHLFLLSAVKTSDVGNGKNGWVVTLNDSQSASLSVGKYVFDCVVNRFGEVIQTTDSLMFAVIQGVTT